MALPRSGEIIDGYRFKGGDPNNESSWEPVSNAPAMGDVVDGYEFQGGNPNQEANWKPVEQTSSPSRAQTLLQDAGVAGVKGLIAVPEMAMGLANIPTLGLAGKLAEKAGIRPKEAKDYLDENLISEAGKAAQQKFDQADGFLDSAKAAIENPSVILNAVTESLPSIGAGGVIGRGVSAVAPKIGTIASSAIGEGLVAAGLNAEKIRQESDTGTLTGKQAALSAATGLTTGLLTRLGGKLAQKFGFDDIDTAAAGGLPQAANKNILRRMAEAGISEGLLEEMPQSAVEQMLTNIAQDKPLMEGVDKAAALGAVTGGAMGSAFQLAPRDRHSISETLTDAAADDALVQQLQADFERDQAGQEAQAALDALSNATTVEEAIALATETIKTPLMPRAEALPAADLIESEVQDGQQDPIAEMAAAAVESEPDLGEGSLRAVPEGTGSGPLHAAGIDVAGALVPGSGDDLAIRNADGEQNAPLMPGEVQAKVDVGSGAIITSAGTPYKTEFGAQIALKSKKLEGQYQVAPVGDGFGLVKIEAQETAEPVTGAIANADIQPADSSARSAETPTPNGTVDAVGQGQNDQQQVTPATQPAEEIPAVVNVAEQQPAPAQTEQAPTIATPTHMQTGEDATMRPMIEQLVKRRAVSWESGFSRQFDTALDKAKRAMRGEEIKPGYFNTVAKLIEKKDPGTAGIVRQIGDYLKNKPAAQDVPVEQSVGQAKAEELKGDPIDQDWTSFADDSGSLGIPRAEMPQIKAEHRGAMVNFLNARGIKSEKVDLPAAELKPTQAEFSQSKVDKAKKFEGGDRSILISLDGHVLDGHHQWLAKLEKGESVPVIRLDAPIKKLLSEVNEFPSATTATGSDVTKTKPGKPKKLKPKVHTLLTAIKSMGGIRHDTKNDVVRDKFAPGGYNQLFTKASRNSLESLVGNGELDEFLPHGMRFSTLDRADGEVPDMQDAIDYLKEKIANGERVIPYDAMLELQEKALDLETAIQHTDEDLDDDEINRLFRLAADEEGIDLEDVEFLDSQDADGDSASSEGTQAGTYEPGADEGLTLTGQSEAEIEADVRAAEERRKADTEAQSRTEINEAAKDFTLAGSDRPADQAAARGAQDLFSPAAAPAQKIEDFGNKIGGAKKDLWQSYRDKLDEAQHEDVLAVPLSKSWPEPDYQALLDGGADPWTVAFMHAARDEIPTKPQKSWKQKEWAKSVSLLRDASLELIDGTLDLERARTLLKEAAKTKPSMRDVLGRMELYQLVGHAQSLKGVRISSGTYSIYNGIEYNPPKTIWSVEKQAKATSFSNWPRQLAIGNTRGEAIEAFKERYESMQIQEPAKREVSFDIYSKRGEKGFFVGKKVGRNYIDLEHFDNVKDARAYLKDSYDALLAKLQKAKEIPSERRDTNNPRVGEDMRGGRDVTPAMFSDAFGFRGVEFGNWVEQGKRQKDLNDAYDALMDMAAILGIPPKAISLNGELGLAFGARGSGGKGAANAHYERDFVVINLTKKEGAGALGHEWWHALDNYFSRMRNKPSDMMTEALDVSLASRGSEFMNNTPVRSEMIKAYGEVMRTIKGTALKARSSKLDAKRSKEYWTTGVEMSARAYESYLISKLQDQNASNDYLANIVDEQTWKAAETLGFELDDSYPYPTAGEVPAIRAAFDTFFNVIEHKETESGVALFSRRPDRVLFTPQLNEGFQRKLAEHIAAFKSGDRKRMQQAGNDPILITRTPVVLRQVLEDDGSKPFKRQDLVVGQGSTLYLKADNLHSRSIHTGKIGIGVLNRLPELLADPIAVFKSSSAGEDTRSFKVLIDAADENGKPIVVAIKPNVPMQQLNDSLVNFQATIFPTTWEQVHAWNRDGLLRYYNDKSPRVSVAASNPREAGSASPEHTQGGFEFPRTSKPASNPRGAGSEDHASEGFEANIGVTASKVKVVTRSEIEGLPPAAWSRGGGRGLATEHVQAIVDSLKAKWENAPTVIVVNDMEDPRIRKAVRDENERQLSQGASGQPEGFFDAGKVYIVASEMSNARDVQRVLLHETLGHYGLRGTFGKDFEPILRNIILARRKEVLAKARQYGLNTKDTNDLLIAAEEVLAEMAQQDPQLNIVQRAIAAIRSWLRAHGFELELTDAEIVRNILEPARQFVQRGDQERNVPGLVAAFKRAQSLDNTPQTETPEFKRWFGDSKVVDEQGKPLVMYHGTAKDFDVFDNSKTGANDMGLWGRGHYFSSNPENANSYALRQGEGARVIPAYVSIQNPLVLRTGDDLVIRMPDGTNMRELIGQNLDGSKIKAVALAGGHDGVIQIKPNGSIGDVVAFRSEQIKSAIGNNGDFDGTNPDIRFSRSGDLFGDWEEPEQSKLDSLIYALQDKNIDLKRVTQNIKKARGDIEDRWNAYLQEELYHGRTAKRTQEFIKNELEPLIEDMRMRGVNMADFEEYLWARHAQERNAQIAKVNPEMPDGGSGMTDAEAEEYLSGLSDSDRKKYEALAKRVDDITRKSRQVLVDYGLESPETISAWEGAYAHYVPLMREDMDKGFGMGTGQGFSVKGNSAKRATGSRRPVVDILANLALQRERNIIRGEKNRVSTALIGLAKLNPNQDFWKTDAVPKIKTVSDKTGLVEERPDQNYKNRDNVIVARIVDKRGDVVEHSVIFNEFNERAMRMAAALKNLDQDQIGEVLGKASVITRYFASINTQYNPIFGILNILRDTQGALLNLSSTPLAGEQKAVTQSIPSAMRGIYKELRARRDGEKVDTKWAMLWEEFQREGGQTGYRDMFRNARERGRAIEHALDPDWWQKTKAGKILTANGALGVPEKVLMDKAVKPLFDWLSDYNETLENSVRLAAYKVALAKGISKQQAASVAKNLTVNFNRKGSLGRQIGSLYAFFNASVQGTARLAETMKGPAGKRIAAGGIILGVLQAFALAAAGFDEDEPPEFIRDRNIIIPTGDGKYLSFAMPLGFHILPAIGRIASEFVLSGFKEPQQRIVHLLDVMADAFNPIGNAGLSMQTVAPTVLDPLAALAENKDFTGRPIAQKDFNSLNPTPGHTRAKDTASAIGKSVSYGINWLTGGNDYQPGALSPTPDQIDYLIGQATGGVGRETMKFEQTATSMVTGEDLPAYKVPLLGRFYGETKGQAPQGGKFYNNLVRINMLENEIKGRLENGQSIDEFIQENPEAELINYARDAYNEIRKLRKQRDQMKEQGASKSEIKAIDAGITEIMMDFNEAVKQSQEKEPA